MERALQANIRMVYLIGLFNAVQFFIPVIVPLLIGKGLSMTEVLQTQAVFALTVAVFEVPSGYIADLYGRKLTLILSSVLMLLSYACLYSAESFIDFLVFEAVCGVAVSLSSGADMALLFDSQLALQKLRKQFELPATVRKLVSLTSIAEAASALVVTVMFLQFAQAIAFEHLLALQFIMGVPPLLLCFLLTEPPRLVNRESLSGNARAITGTLLLGDRVVLSLSVAIVVFGLVALMSFWTYQRFWDFKGVPLEWFGLLWAIHCLIRSATAHFAEGLEKWLGANRLLLLMTLLPPVAFLGMAGLPGWAAVACALIFPVCRGLNAVILVDGLNRRISGEFRATINSILNLAIRILFIGFGPLLGMAVDRYGINPTLWGMAVLCVPALFAATWMLLRKLRVQSSPAAKPAVVLD